MSFVLKGVDQAVEFVTGIEPAVKRAEYRAVNKVADKTATKSKRLITTIVSLTPTYVGQRLSVDKASLDRPVAVITGRDRPTKLYTYGAKMVTVASPRSKGNVATGLSPGRKQAGVKVGVKPGGAKKLMPSAFILPLKNGNGLGVFTRSGGRLKHHYGPSIDQTFTLVIKDIKDEVADDLEKTFAAQLEFELK